MKSIKVPIISAIFAVSAVFVLCNGQLTSMSVKERDCPADFATLDLLRARDNYAAIPFLVRANVCPYLPMASPFTYRRYAEVFLGRPAADQAELDAMGYRGITFYNYGYGKLQFAQGGAPYYNPNSSWNDRDKYIVNFPFIPFSDRPGTNVSALRLITAGLVWTDNSTTVLVVDCFNGDALDWGVYSIYPTISDEIKALVLDKIRAYGFNPDLAQYMSYPNPQLFPGC